MAELTPAHADKFLRDLHVGVLSVERQSNPPLAVPIWYDVNQDGDVIVWTGESAPKTKLIRKAGRASFTVQQEALPYTYVVIEGRTTIGPSDAETVLRMATRYLGKTEGAKFAASSEIEDSVVITIHADRVRSFSFTD